MKTLLMIAAVTSIWGIALFWVVLVPPKAVPEPEKVSEKEITEAQSPCSSQNRVVMVANLVLDRMGVSHLVPGALIGIGEDCGDESDAILDDRLGPVGHRYNSGGGSQRNGSAFHAGDSLPIFSS